MTASLYHCGLSSRRTDSLLFTLRFTAIAVSSHEIIEILLAPDARAHPKDLSRLAVRIQLDVVALPVPEIASISQKIMNLEGLLWIESEFFRRQLHPTRLSVMGIQVDCNHDDVT